MSWSWSSVYIARCCCCGLELLVKHRQAGGTQRAEKDIGMSAGAVLALQIAAGALVAALVVAVIVAAAWGGAGRGGAAVHDGNVERALGAATVTTYERAAGAPTPPGTQGAAQCACAAAAPRPGRLEFSIGAAAAPARGRGDRGPWRPSYALMARVYKSDRSGQTATLR